MSNFHFLIQIPSTASVPSCVLSTFICWCQITDLAVTVHLTVWWPHPAGKPRGCTSLCIRAEEVGLLPPYQGQREAHLNTSSTFPSPLLIHSINKETGYPLVLSVQCPAKPLSSLNSPASYCPFPVPFPANASACFFRFHSSCSSLKPF